LEAAVEAQDLIRLLMKNGWIFLIEGGNRTIFAKDDQIEQVPRHQEIDEKLARFIIKKRNLK